MGKDEPAERGGGGTEEMNEGIAKSDPRRGNYSSFTTPTRKEERHEFELETNLVEVRQ